MLKVRLSSPTILSILLLVVISRIFMLFTGYMGMNLFASYQSPPDYKPLPPGSIYPTEMMLPLRLEDTKRLHSSDFYKFDTFSYMSIATQGYDEYAMNEPHPPANWVFFPLYPLLLFLAGKLFGLLALHNPITVGMIISNLFFFISLLYIYLI